MTPAQTVAAALSAGIVLDVRDGQLIARPKELLTDELRAELKRHRERILQILLIPKTAPEPPGGRLYWQARTHVCSTSCTREHTTCNACGQPLRPQDQHWPHLHLNCRLGLAE